VTDMYYPKCMIQVYFKMRRPKELIDTVWLSKQICRRLFSFQNKNIGCSTVELEESIATANAE
jgi:hypothetical protein